MRVYPELSVAKSEPGPSHFVDILELEHTLAASTVPRRAYENTLR
jgi:hypothetical protein